MSNSNIQTVDANGINIAYEFYGDENAPVILLIHGLGMPMTAWPMAMVNKLVEKGFRVLRIDNRDQGQSQKFDHLKTPNVVWQFIKFKLGLPVSCPYPLTDMMKDVVATLDALNIDKVHVVGASMGGMISQLLAIHAPARVKTLTSIMSTTGNRKLPAAKKDVMDKVMAKPSSSTVEGVVEYHMNVWKAISSPGFPTSEEDLKAYVQGLLDRGVSEHGTTRQLLAIIATPSRVKDLAKLTIPSLVIHGSDDPLVRVEGGIDTANAIPNAQQHIIEGMAHDLPVQLHDEICGLIATLATAEEEKLKAAS